MRLWISNKPTHTGFGGRMSRPETRTRSSHMLSCSPRSLIVFMRSGRWRRFLPERENPSYIMIDFRWGGGCVELLPRQTRPPGGGACLSAFTICPPGRTDALIRGAAFKIHDGWETAQRADVTGRPAGGQAARHRAFCVRFPRWILDVFVFFWYFGRIHQINQCLPL